MDIQFAGEHLLPGKLGQFFVILSFGTALLAAISYYFFTIKDKSDNSWQTIARVSTWLNSISVIGIGASLFYIIYNHLFEYHYAWAHSSKALPVYYIVSCFWEGQEGSFWLWTFWQAVLANILIWKAKSWEGPVLTIVMISQAMLASMLIGVEILGTRVGSSPFILLRNALEAPIFSRPDYLTLIQDGNGLNPLLQNYWMVIHPPTLFLGFASMIVPFAYAIAGLWQRKYNEWLKPAMPYTLFAVMVLGTGIIMGSFWAYEALNFGGFWAWDPVENASIIPWLTLIAAVHVLIVYKNSGHSFFTAIFLVLISFVLVLYASFLTRSGVLGETSVHAFTDLGMYWHLVVDVALFAAIAIFFLVKRWKELPISKKDEETFSREFWMFIGALVLTVACVQIIATTSIPVFNAIFKTKVAPPSNPVEHYNKWQVPFAIVIALLSGFTQFLKYKNTDVKKVLKSLTVSIVISLLVAALFVWITKIANVILVLLIITSLFAVVSNGKVLVDSLKGKWKLAGSAVAHIGFGLILLGALIAAATNKVITVNSNGSIPVAGFEKDNKPGENLMLYQDSTVKINRYSVTYLSDTTVGPNTFYKVNYKAVDDKTGKVKEDFNLYPNAQQNPKMGLVASPDTKHYLTYDIYTHVSSVPVITENTDEHSHESHSDDENYLDPLTKQVNIGDTVRYREGFILVKAVNRNAKIQNIPIANGDLAVSMTLEVHTKNKVFTTEPVYLLKSGNEFDFGKTIEEAGLKLRFTHILPEKNKLELMVYQKKPAEKKWIVMKAIMFPYINLFWGGTIIMVIGFLLSIFRRIRENKITTVKAS
ncbi:cytochrome C biogenesis protein [Pedobacter sp. HMF7647]|uniref:Cytochrome C biogenesis protein n=1 Tax=Hufsiella arboris TaxID=2695275 RepID=A0A7K1YAE0_9SPHI|nr:cytochrome c biogenesis protein CcsA [Hufsiella arboris]MXV51546.1 cytochrome C biogenesis protein [Hufsiella arboris]